MGSIKDNLNKDALKKYVIEQAQTDKYYWLMAQQIGREHVDSILIIGAAYGAALACETVKEKLEGKVILDVRSEA